MNYDKEILNFSLGDVIDYIQGPKYQSIAQAIAWDSVYFTEKTVKVSSQEEKALMLANFVIGYKDDNINGHLVWFGNDPKVMNARIGNVPIIAFAKLNSPKMAEALIEKGAADIETEVSKNKEYVLELSHLFGCVPTKTSSNDAMSLIRNMVRKNREEQNREK